MTYIPNRHSNVEPELQLDPAIADLQLPVTSVPYADILDADMARSLEAGRTVVQAADDLLDDWCIRPADEAPAHLWDRVVAADIDMADAGAIDRTLQLGRDFLVAYRTAEVAEWLLDRYGDQLTSDERLLRRIVWVAAHDPHHLDRPDPDDIEDDWYLYTAANEDRQTGDPLHDWVDAHQVPLPRERRELDVTVDIPASWVGLCTYGQFDDDGETLADRIGRPVGTRPADDVADPQPRSDDSRTVRATIGDELEAIVDLGSGHADGAHYYVGVTIEMDVPTGIHALDTIEPQISDLQQYPHEVATTGDEVYVHTRIVWPTPNARQVAIDTVKRIWQASKPVAARAVDELRAELLPAGPAVTLEQVVGALGIRHLSAPVVGTVWSPIWMVDQSAASTHAACCPSTIRASSRSSSQ